MDKMMLDRGQGEAVECKSTRLCLQKRRYATTVVFIIRSKKMKVTTVRSMLQSLDEGDGAVFVGSGPPTSFARKEIAAAGSQYFETKELIVPVVMHPLVPPHKKVPAPPAGVQKKNLPVLTLEDPVSKYYWFKQGDVVEIDRGEYKYYRVVR